MSDVVTTVEGHTNAAYLALELLKQFQEETFDAEIDEESFHIVATHIPDFSEDEPSYDIDTMDDLENYAFDHGFTIERAHGVIKAVTNNFWEENSDRAESKSMGIDGFDALAQAENDGGVI